MPKLRTLARFEEHSLALFAALVMSSGGAVAQVREQGVMVQTQASQPASRPASDAHFQRVDAAFDRTDANGDGKLSRDEVQRLPAVAERFDEFDTNGDHQLSREEFQRGVAH
jgi:Ca2+-binding EF-hand superfamily protein